MKVLNRALFAAPLFIALALSAVHSVGAEVFVSPSTTTTFSSTAASGTTSPLLVAGYSSCSVTVSNAGGGVTLSTLGSADGGSTFVTDTTFPTGGVFVPTNGGVYQGNAIGYGLLELSWASNLGTFSGTITCYQGGGNISAATPAPQVVTQGTSPWVVTVPNPAPTNALGNVLVANDGTVSATASAAPVNIGQVGATAVLNGGTAGTLGIAGFTPTGGTIVGTNPVLGGCESITQGLNATSGANHTLSPVRCDPGGDVFMRFGSPRYIGCVKNFASATTLTCVGAAGTGLTQYITDVAIASASTQTVGTLTISQGTGTNCATTINAISIPYNIPAGATNIFDHYFVPIFNNTPLSLVCITMTGTTVSTVVVVNGFAAY